MPAKLRKLKTIQREDSLDFEEFQNFDSHYSSENPKLNKCYSYHFSIGYQIVSGWGGLCDIDDVPILHDPISGSYDLRSEMFQRILREFKYELYSKMYKVSLSEAIIQVELDLVKELPKPAYEEYTLGGENK